MHVLIAGGTGLIGTALTDRLQKRGDKVRILTRTTNRFSAPTVEHVLWNTQSDTELENQVSWADAVVNLAGANIGSKRWSRNRKQAILHSRLDSTQALVAAVTRSNSPPDVFVQASAVGFYGYHPIETVLTEDSPPGSDFLAEVCQSWEAAAEPLHSRAPRLLTARFGVVLSNSGGALKRMLPPARLGAGGKIGTGLQPFPWIHIDDTTAALVHLIDTAAVQGPVNLVSPHGCSNGEFSKSLAQAVRRPILLSLPAFQVRLMFGEMGDMLLQGQNASAHKLVESGFTFTFPEREAALIDLV